MKRFFAHIGFSVAITLIVMCLASTKFVIISTIGLAILFIASLCLRYFRSNITVPLCLGASVFACVLLLAYSSFVVAPQRALDHTDGDISFYVVDLEDKNEYGEYVYTAKLTNGNKVRIKSDTPINADYYTIVNARARFYSIGDSPYSSYGYWSDSIYLSASIDDIAVTNKVVRSPMVNILHLRQSIISVFSDIIGGDEGGIAIALVTGNKGYISRLVYDYFRYSGTTHIMAVSGLHLTVVAGAILFLLKKLRLPDYIISPVVIVTILSYMALAGFSKSIVRAGIMMGIMVSAPLFKTYGDSLNSLGLAVFIICLNPYAVTDFGAMLSVLSTLSMILTSRLIIHNPNTFESKIDEKIGSKVLDRFKAVYYSISILIFTLPILYLMNGYMNISSIVANVVAVPLGSLAMIMAVVCFLLQKFSIFAIITKWIIHIIIAFLRYISSFSGTIIPLGDYFAIVIIGVLVIIAVCFIYKNGVLLRKGIALSLVFAIASSVMIYGYTRNDSYIYVTKNGASVVEHNGYVVVGGVEDLSDCYSINSFLQSHNEDIDVLVANADAVNTVKLTQAVHTNILLTNDFDTYILDIGCFDDIEVKNDYAIDFGDGFELYYHYGEYSVTVNGVKAGFGKISLRSDIFVDLSAQSITDKQGVIDLSNGNIVYTIKGNSFSARRTRIWQE